MSTGDTGSEILKMTYLKSGSEYPVRQFIEKMYKLAGAQISLDLF